ncbi:MAG: V-type ATPase subunit [bacterium]|jgi:V/A-type H+-transporting ATPase subunit C|nr:V-type ATPase subunit [bacterium]MDD3805138.1 V-type ATPase subunit [bacterium]MDD4152248.1 V-type ATPase subunit [bacterium]MDD4559019.1 V-type ATPase subunit [bacterium]
MYNDIRYAYATGRIRSLQKDLVDETTIRRMLEAPDEEAAFAVIMETSYAAYATGAGVSDYERMLESGLIEAYRLVRSISPDGALTDILLRRYDLHNVRIIIKAEHIGTDYKHLIVPMGRIDPDTIAAAWHVSREKREERSESSHISPLTSQILLPRWLERLLYRAALMIDNSGDLYLVDLMLDKAWFRALKVWSKKNSHYLYAWLIVRIDAVNIMGMLRLRASGWSRERWREIFIEGGRVSRGKLESLYDLAPEQAAAGLLNTAYRREIEEGLEDYRKHGELSYMEALFEARLLEVLQAERYITFGSQPLLAYLLRKEAEVRALRMVMIGKLNGLPHDIIHKRLRAFLCR